MFGAAVAGPVRLHVNAKRYLCAVKPEYHARLSAASIRSLELQGGAFESAEAMALSLRPRAAEAIQFRRWDDLAKDSAVETKPLAAYGPLLRGLAL